MDEKIEELTKKVDFLIELVQKKTCLPDDIWHDGYSRGRQDATPLAGLNYNIVKF